MLIFLRANLAPSKTPIAKSLELSHEPRFTIREASAKHPDKQEITLAWHITTHAGTPITWHNGMTGGYSSYMAFVPSKNLDGGPRKSGDARTDKLGNDLILRSAAR